MTIDTAEFREFYRKERLCISRPLGEPSPDFIAHINAHVARQVQAARDQALEEAARVCERVIDPTRINTTSAYSDFHAEAIRALKATPQEAASTWKGAK